MSKPKSIALVVRRLDSGGCERDLTRLALTLPRDEWRPHVVSLRSGGVFESRLEQAGLPPESVDLANLRPWALAPSIRKFRQIVRERQIELVHAFDLPASVFAAHASPFCGPYAVVSSQLGYPTLYPLKDRLLMRSAFRLSDRVVANSAALKDELSSTIPRLTSKLSVVHNGIDLDEFQPPADRAAARSILPPAIRDRGLVISSICVMRPEKQLSTLIEAAAALDNSDIGFVVVGDGEMKQQWQAHAQRLGLGDRFHWEPPSRQVAKWLQASDAFVLCSSSEAFPNAVLEAMACGCCVIATRVGGVPEMVTDQDTGLLLPPGEPSRLARLIETIANDPELRHQLARNAVRFVNSQFTQQRCVERTIEVYERALGANGRENGLPEPAPS